MATKQKASDISNGGNLPTNDGSFVIETEQPYMVRAEILGVADVFFHAYSVEGVEGKAAAAKGSKASKEDDLESYVYRDEKGYLSIPGEHFRMAIVEAAKFRKDPRSPRKSAMDLFKAAIFPNERFCSLGVKDWEYVDRRRANIHGNGITRARPAVYAGWKCTLDLSVVLPEYVTPQLLNEVLQLAGRVQGVCDNRPSYGRFQVTRFQVQ